MRTPLVATLLLLAACTRVPPPDTRPETLVIGTIHKGHLVQPAYTLGHLQSALDAYTPDLVLVEIRPQPYAAGHSEDGPFEMTYVTDLATSRHIPVEPIDWFRDDAIGMPDPPMSPADRAAAEAETAPLALRGWPTFAEANAPATRSRLAREQNAWARWAAGNPDWSQRQAWFNEQARAAIDRHHARRTMAFVGYQHRAELEGYLFTTGVRVRDAAELTFPTPSPDAPAPPSVVAAWKAGADRLDAEAAAATGEAKQRLAAKARYFRVAITREGRCCVDEK